MVKWIRAVPLAGISSRESKNRLIGAAA